MTDCEIPDFVAEVIDADAESTAAGDREALLRGAEALPDLLAPLPPSGGGLGRLMKQVEELPDRYAPFFDQLQALYALSEDDLRRQLSRARDESAWRATGLPGVRVFDVRHGDSLEDTETLLVRFRPGTKFPKHRHRGRETTLVLEGRYEDTNGVLVSAGDIQVKQPDTEHGLLIAREEPCIAAAALEHGFVFSAWPLRAWAKLVRG